MKRNAIKAAKAFISRLPMAQGMWIQSPTDFEIANDVINGTFEYYAFGRMKAGGEGTEGTRTNRMLFRLANYLQPDTIIEAGACEATAMNYMAEARRKARHIFAPGKSNSTATAPETEAEIHTGDICHVIEKTANDSSLLIHFATTADAAEVQDAILMTCRSRATHTTIAMEGIDSGKKKEIWKNLITDKNICKTFDLYDTGIAIFGKRTDRARHYRLMF